MNKITDLGGVKQLALRLRNWGRWGANDELGTINFATGEKIVNAARLVRKGKVFSLSIPFDSAGP
ncbi:MAG: cyclase family protein, partial [Candidatus Bathyarchaeota archaeon]|nr:cyclase family protein [Candidatus Bathyarchaeota archaeon]